MRFSTRIGWAIVARAVTPPPLDLAQLLGIEAASCAHLEEALTHPSYANEHKGSARDNQRLEFLGDAVLGLCVSEMLMDRFPEAREGELSLMRASLVNSDALALWARDAALGEALRVGRGADAAGERAQKNVLADAVEAIVGAVYLDLGLESARRVASTIVEEPLERLANGPRLGRDPKSELQERVQARGGTSPKYRVVETIGPDHNREFVVAVEVDGESLGVGRGRSKKQAEQEAARDAMQVGHPLALAVQRGDLPLPRYTVDDSAEGKERGADSGRSSAKVPDSKASADAAQPSANTPDSKASADAAQPSANTPDSKASADAAQPSTGASDGVASVAKADGSRDVEET